MIYSYVINRVTKQRGPFVDSFYGAAYPLQGKNFKEADAIRIRENVAAYCLGEVGKPYNINFLNSSTENAFYCSQLAYKAYLTQGINLNTGIGIPEIPGTESIIYPQEIWNGCKHTP